MDRPHVAVSFSHIVAADRVVSQRPTVQREQVFPHPPMPANPPAAESRAIQRDTSDWIEVACVSKPHGIGGELRVKLHNAESRVLFEVDEVLLRKGVAGSRAADAADRVVTVRSARPAAAGFVLLGLRGVDSRNTAEALRGFGLCVPRDRLPEETEGEFYVHDILGANVLLKDGSVLGAVVDYISYPSTDVLVVQGSERYEIPLIEDFVLDVNTETKVVVVDGVDDFKVS